MPSVIAQFVGALLRHLLGGVFAWMVAQGWIDAADSEKFLIGLIGFILTVAWSLWQKYVAKRQTLTALTLQAGSDAQDVTAKIAQGEAPAVFKAGS